MSIGNGKIIDKEDDIMSLIGVCRKCRCALLVEIDMTVMSPEQGARMVANMLKEHTASCGGIVEMDRPDPEDAQIVSSDCINDIHESCDVEECNCECHDEADKDE